jgi:hypothetical protein
MSDVYIGPVVKIQFISELKKTIFLHITLRCFYSDYHDNILLPSNGITEYNNNYLAQQQFSLKVYSYTLHICPQSHLPSHSVPPVEDIYEHECADVPEPISIRFQLVGKSADNTTATIIVTECHDLKSPSSLRDITLWKCISQLVPSQTIQEYIRNFPYEHFTIYIPYLEGPDD